MTFVEQFRNVPQPVHASREPMSNWVIFGWIISLVGLALWLYGYVTIGTPPLIDWYWVVPLWIENFIRNLQCEAGMAFTVTGMSLISWPHL
jgi:hypothetical protein